MATANTCAVVFLFDADAEGVSSRYGAEFDPAFLHAVSATDPEGTIASGVFRGDAIPSSLAEKTTSVSSSHGHSSHTRSHDMEVYRTVIWDFADALNDQWHTVDNEEFALTLAQRNVHCISVPTLRAEFCEGIDDLLKGQRGYLGAIEFDLGNPIQVILFIDLLIKDSAILNGQVVMELSFEGDPESDFVGAESFMPNGVGRVAYGRLRALIPPIPFPPGPSPRGKISLDRYRGKRQFTLQERVTSALAASSNPASASYAFSVAKDLTNPLEANLPEAKFVSYLLNTTHPKGADKARFFAEALGIERTDWRYLAAQFHDGLKTADLTEINVKSFAGGFGASFNAVIPIRGLNGRTIAIDTNWIMEPGQLPRLSTAVPAKARQTVTGQGVAPPIVSSALDGDERWAAIHVLAAEAGQRAAKATTPTPMKIVDGPLIMDGACGYAWVRVKDARRGFARWAIANGQAYRHYQSGAQIFAASSTQSVDRAIAYANAYAAVLRHNGIDSTVESRLD